MSKAVKFAVSMPEKEFKEVETIRRKERLSRSAMVFEAISMWRKAKVTDELVRRYEEGYRKFPERQPEVEAWEKAGLCSFTNESWE